MKDKIILTIPGMWPDHQALVESLADATDDVISADGSVLLDHRSQKSCEYTLSNPAPDMEQAFRFYSEATPLSEALLSYIARHKSFLSLHSRRDGHKEALFLSDIANAVLDAGGLAVRVEGSRRASYAELWSRSTRQAHDLGPSMLIGLFVWAFVSDENSFDTIGMTFLGHPDFSIVTTDFEEANEIYQDASKYMFYKDTQIKDGDTIKAEHSNVRWRMTKTEHIYADDPDIDFSRGMWRLERI